MDSNELNKYSYTKKLKTTAQLKRRDTYNRVSAGKKKELLLARRMRKKTSAEGNVLQNPPDVIHDESTSPCCKTGFPKQTVLTIREPSLPAEIDLKENVPSSLNILEKQLRDLFSEVHAMIKENVPTRSCYLKNVHNFKVLKEREKKKATRGWKVAEGRKMAQATFHPQDKRRSWRAFLLYGRARHGTLCGPQFRGGSTMHGPKPRTHAMLSAYAAEGKEQVHYD